LRRWTGRHHRSKLEKKRRWESNPLPAALQAAALPSGSGVRCVSELQKMSSPGFGPGLRPSQSRVRSTTLRGRELTGGRSSRCAGFFRSRGKTGSAGASPSQIKSLSTPPRIRTSSGSFEGCRASTTLAGQFAKILVKEDEAPDGLRRRLAGSCLDLDSNQDRDLRRVRCDPLHHRDASHLQIRSHRADGWIRTSIILFTRVILFIRRGAPYSVEPRRQSTIRASTSARSRTS
jgi:hypothetical protein